MNKQIMKLLRGGNGMISLPNSYGSADPTHHIPNRNVIQQEESYVDAMALLTQSDKDCS